MAEKIECDRCGAQAPGKIIDDAGELSPNRDKDSNLKPSVKDWSFVRAPRLDGKPRPIAATLVCPVCVAALIEWLKPLPVKSDAIELSPVKIKVM